MQTDMQHPDSERLAAFDHEAPTPDELAHLAACASCRAQREDFVALAAAAVAYRDADAPRLTSWDSVAPALRSEGLLKSTVDITPVHTPVVVRAFDSGARVAAMRPRQSDTELSSSESQPSSRVARALPSWMRAAAAIAIMAGGVLAGRISAGAPPIPIGALAGASDSADAWSNASMSTALRNTALGGNQSFSSVEEATVALTEAQRVYERASLWLAGNDTTTRSSDVYRARLAALDQMMVASRAALRDAPQDPMLNHYFLAAYTAREATLQQLGGSLPVDKTIESY